MVFKCLSLNLDKKLPLTTLSSNYYRLQGKVAIITGGASGIGASAAQIFHKNGAKVVIADVHDDLGKALAEKLGEGVMYIHCDVSNEGEIINIVDTTVSKFGKLDIMYINGCSTLECSFGSILDSSKSDLERLLAVNTIGGFLAAKHAARVMVPRRKGCILFAGSDCAETAYGVSQFGILGLVRSLAKELGQTGVRVNCVSPYYGFRMSAKGGVDTVISTEESIADAVLYMVSDESSYVSGQNLVVNGGFSFVNPTTLRAFNFIK